MTEICIIRHGETDWNAQSKMQGHSDIPLNETGRSQASVTAEYLKDEHWDVIYSSPLSRACETARIISNALGIKELRIEKDLIECNFGVAEGMIIEERKILYPDRNQIPKAETLDNLKLRVKRILNDISERHKEERILIVSHGCFIMEVIETFSNGRINGRKTPLKNLSMTLLTRDSGWNIPWFNRSALDPTVEEDSLKLILPQR